MTEKIRRAATAFFLTLILLGSGIALTLAYDRMEREINGIPEAGAGELAIGSRNFPFDLHSTREAVESIRGMLKWVGGIPYAWFETLFFCADTAADTLRQAIFAEEIYFP